jgi:hypothetical protein
MRPNDSQRDPVLAILADLPVYDVSPARAQRLRTRCHRCLEPPDTSSHATWAKEADAGRRAVSVLAGGWCVVYLLETIRRAAVVYGF